MGQFEVSSKVVSRAQWEGVLLLLVKGGGARAYLHGRIDSFSGRLIGHLNGVRSQRPCYYCDYEVLFAVLLLEDVD
jgi:hypothetical protein